MPRNLDEKRPRATGAGGRGPAGCRKRSERLGDLAGAKAAGADLHAPDRTALDRFDLLEIGIPDAGGLIVGVADVISEARTFAADITDSGHG